MIIDKDDERFGRMQNIKRRMFALRNGIVADTLRRAGDPHRIIFGLNLPQLVEIAQATGPDARLAEMLMANDSTRESRLLAPMLMPADGFGIDDAHRWVSGLLSAEEADILCHRLLRHTAYASPLAAELAQADEPLSAYCGLRLMFNLLNMRRIGAVDILKVLDSRDYPAPASALARQLRDEAEFLTHN